MNTRLSLALAITAAALSSAANAQSPAMSLTGVTATDLSKLIGSIGSKSKDAFSLVTPDEETEFSERDIGCQNLPQPEQCRKNNESRRQELQRSRQAEVIRLSPPRLKLDDATYAQRLANLPAWHPERRVLSAVLQEVAPFLDRAADQTTLQAPEAAGAACLKKEANARSKALADAFIQAPVTDAAAALERDKRLAIMSKIAGDLDADKPRVSRATTFHDEAHKEAYRVRSEEFVELTLRHMKVLRTANAEQTLIYQTWEDAQTQLRECRDRKEGC